MWKLFGNTAGYVFLRYLLFLIAIYIFYKEAKFVSWSDMRNNEDWFYFFWLFGIPVIIEIIIVGVPLAFGLSRVTNSNSKWYYLLFLLLFAVEFTFANYLYGIQYSILKISISLVLFFVFFWRILRQVTR